MGCGGRQRRARPSRPRARGPRCRPRRFARRHVEHRGSADAAAPQALERLVRPLEWKRLDHRPHRYLRREREKLLAVTTRQVGDRAQHTLLPEQVVRESRDVRHVNAGADDRAALCEGAQRERNERADGSEDDRRVEFLGRRLVGAAGPDGAQLTRERLSLLVAGTREGEDAAPLVPRDLRHDVRGGAEAVETEPLGVAREPERPIPDQAGAQEGSRLETGIALGKWEAKALIDDRVLGVAAVEVVSGEARMVTEVLAPGAAEGTLAVRPAQPGNPDAAILAHNCSDDLVAEHERQLRVWKLAVEDVEVGSADPTGLHLDEQLPRPWGGFRHLRLPQ